jgi:hypothetical protein
MLEIDRDAAEHHGGTWMFKNARRLVLSIGLLATLAFAQPAQAYVETGTTGTVGVHSLTDTSSSPGARCDYDYSPSNGWMLQHISVRPPRMKAVAGQGNERVAWHFTIQRRVFDPDAHPWKTQYTSPNYFTHTNSSTYASFSREGVDISPPFLPGGQSSAVYRVIVKLIWYRSNGDVLGTATERVEHYDDWTDPYHNGSVGYCTDYFM